LAEYHFMDVIKGGLCHSYPDISYLFDASLHAQILFNFSFNRLSLLT